MLGWAKGKNYKLLTKLHMTQKIRYIGLGSIVSALFLLALCFSYVARANPSFFTRANSAICGNYTATTSPSFMTAGTATTTYTFDTGCGTANSTDSAVFAMQLTGSSTATVLTTVFEYSQDGVDWYSDTLSQGATTTPGQALTTARTYTLTFASSTVGGAGGTGNGRVYRTVTVPTPTRYVRAIQSLAPASTNGAVWGEFIAKRQGN